MEVPQILKLLRHIETSDRNENCKPICQPVLNVRKTIRVTAKTIMPRFPPFDPCFRIECTRLSLGDETFLATE